MTGTGHRLTGIGAAFIGAALMRINGGNETEQVIAGFIAMGTTRIPDQIEFPSFNNGVKTGSLIPHRTITHWPFLWIALWCYCNTFDGYIAAAGLGVAVGALTHILWDAPNPMGIPWVLPYKRISLGKKGLWRSGRGEYLIVTLYGALGFWFWTFTARWAK